MTALNQQVRHVVLVTNAGSPVTGLLDASFTKSLKRRSGSTFVADTATVTFTEIDASGSPGLYWVTYTPATATGIHYWSATRSPYTLTPAGGEDDITGGSALSVGPYLTTRDNVKQALNIGTSTDDQRIDALLAAVTTYCQNHCSRQLVSATVTEYHDALGTDRIRLHEYPLASITSVHCSITAPRVYDATTLLSANSYLIEGSGETGQVYRVDGAKFPTGTNTVKAVYVAGFASIPSDLEDAAIMIIAVKLRKRKDQSYHIASESRGDGSVVYTGDNVDRFDVPIHARQILDLYRRTD